MQDAAFDRTDLRMLAYLQEHGRASNLELAQAAIDAVRVAAHKQLAVTPYSFRKIGQSPTRRELIIPFGATGYIALYEIVDATSVLVLAVRHQREEDYH